MVKMKERGRGGVSGLSSSLPPSVHSRRVTVFTAKILTGLVSKRSRPYLHQMKKNTSTIKIISCEITE